MKKFIKASLCVVVTILMFSSIKAQTPAYKGIYIDSFDGILGNVVKEDSLLNYLKDSSFNSIICYRMSNVISATPSNTKNTILANFLKRARTQFGIKNVLASSESFDTFNTLIAPYNRSRLDSNERFNYYYLEFEFWNSHSTSPVSAANNGYYCTTYLSPKGYNCDTAGAFKYYKKMLKSLDSLALHDGIRCATYVGNPNQGQCKFIANTVDLLLCDNYTSSISNIYSDVKTLFSYFGSTSKTLQIVPIFASYSPGGNFLGDWLTKVPSGPHSEKSVYNNYFLPRFTAETGAWKTKLNLVGYQWYRYSGMPHNGNYSTGTFCNPPSNISAASITASSALLKWTGITSGLGYIVQYRVSGTNAWSASLAASGTTLSLTGLSPATTYEFQVKSSCISSTSAYSASVVFSTTGTSSCAVPVGLNATAITSVSAALSWTAVSGASSYSIQYRKVGATAWTSSTSTSASKSIVGLVVSSIYEYQVKTTCPLGSSAFSGSYLFSTLAPTCTAPIGLATSAVKSNSATLKWTAITGVSGYTIQYRVVGTAAWLTTSSTGSSKSVLALLENTLYEFQVQTKCSATNASPFSASGFFTTLPTACGSPTNVTASAATTTSFTINWSPVPGASSYKVQYRKTSSSTWTTITTSTAFKNIASLATATDYEFQVAAVCSNGTSAYSAIALISTQSNATSCGVPTGLFETNVALNSVTLNWLPVNGASSYKVQYRKVGTSAWSNKTTSFTNKNITSLSANTNYEFQVQTICSSGNSLFSNSSFFVTTPTQVAARMAANVDSLTTSSSNRMAPIVAEKNKMNNVEEFKIFPNPTDIDNINLRIQMPQKANVTVQLFDMLGKLLFTEIAITDETGFAEIKIRTETKLNVGIYQVIGTSEFGKYTSKLIIN
ncbi:MAG: fibronectin type III domain-containing protein [Bacteroidetes bacterium]|nr:fibronectin type III domain-containing protein [Bacteroidota bacterium]